MWFLYLTISFSAYEEENIHSLFEIFDFILQKCNQNVVNDDFFSNNEHIFFYIFLKTIHQNAFVYFTKILFIKKNHQFLFLISNIFTWL